MKRMVFLLSFLVLSCLFMGGCVAEPPTAQITPQLPTNSPTEVPTVESVADADSIQHLDLSSGLTIDQYKLKNMPAIDPLTFTPISSSQDEILSKHAKERKDWFPDNLTFDNGVFTRKMILNGKDLIAQVTYSSSQNSNYQKATVIVLLDNEEIYSIKVGDASPLTPLEGLWTYENHWAIEAVSVDAIRNLKENSESDIPTGAVVVDGEPLNEKYGYQETFGFQLINNKPFYFFKKDDKIGISYDGQETLLGYDQIPHYGCCSGAETNPKQAKNMVSFFAQKDGTWYYVEIGVFK